MQRDDEDTDGDEASIAVSITDIKSKKSVVQIKQIEIAPLPQTIAYRAQIDHLLD